jgi:hypothetical protein
MGKFSRHRPKEPFGPGVNSHPAQTGTNDERNEEVRGQLTQVLSNRALNEVKAGYSHFGFRNELLTDWSKHWQAPRVTNGHPRITLTGFSIAGNANYPRHRDQRVSFVRDDFTFSYDARGRHDLKVGGEFVRHYEDSENCNNCGGAIVANNGIIPPDILQAIFPDPFNVDTWNLAGLSPYTRTYTIGIGEFPLQYGQPKFAAWLQDDWRIGGRLTLNLGLRYDVSFNSWANEVGVAPFYPPGRPNDVNNLQPRLGFAYQLNDKTVIRGGSGFYYADALTMMPSFVPQRAVSTYSIQQRRTGGLCLEPAQRPAADHRAGAEPLATQRHKRPTLPRSGREETRRSPAVSLECLPGMPAPEHTQAGNWQTSISIQRRFEHDRRTLTISTPGAPKRTPSVTSI